MGIFDKIKFWRKSEDEFSDLGLGGEFGEPGAKPTPGVPGPTPPGMPELGPEGKPAPGGLPEMPGEEPAQPPGGVPGAGTPYGTVQAAKPPAAFEQLPPSPPAKGQEHEIVIAKLDAIKAYLDSINQRLANLERTIRENEKRW